MTPCANHPGRDAAESIGAWSLCEECRRERIQAAGALGHRVPHAQCCVARSPRGEWVALPNDVGVHWLAHELRVKAMPGSPICLLGFPIRLEDLLQHRRELAGRPLSPGDVWVDLGGSHCGLVVGVQRDEDLRATIRHLCPKRRMVVTEDFYAGLGGRGSFYR